MTLLADTRPDSLVSSVSLAGSAGVGAASPASPVEDLQARIRQMQATRLDEKSQPGLPGLAGLLPQGLRPGAAYSVTGSTTLALALLVAPSAQGTWCGVLGMPDLGTEAAARLGIDLARLVLVPSPGTQWLTVAAAMADVLGVVVAAAPTRVTAADASRLTARLRQKSTTLILLGDWPGAEATLRVSSSTWAGLGDGHGYLGERQLLVDVTGRSGQSRPVRVTLPTAGSPRAQPAGTAASVTPGLLSFAPLRPVPGVHQRGGARSIAG